MALPNGLNAQAYLPTHVRRELDMALPIAAGAPRRLAKTVQERLYLAGFALRIDGDFGPATTQQLINFQSAHGLPANGIYGAAEHDLLCAPFVAALNPVPHPGASMGDLVIQVARQHIKQRPVEVGGQNRGPWVRIYMDGNDGDPWLWCAGFCFFLIGQACSTLGIGTPMKPTFGVDVIADRAKTAGRFLSEKQASTPAGRASIRPGSLFMVRASGSHYIHTGIVSGVNGDSFSTCEGNSNDDGSSNGFEALERVRGFAGKDFVVW